MSATTPPRVNATRHSAFDADDLKLIDLRQRRVLDKLLRLEGRAASDAPRTFLAQQVRLRQGGRYFASPPPKHPSLFKHYRHRFELAGDAEQRLCVCACAELDYLRAVRGPRTIEWESQSDRADRVLVEYEGIPTLEAAWCEGTTERSIADLRSKHGRNRETGYPLPE